MDNKIIIEFIMREINDLHIMIDSLSEKDALSPFLVDIAKTKAQSLYQEFILLSEMNPISLQEKDSKELTQAIPKTNHSIPIPSVSPISTNGSFNLSQAQQSEISSKEEKINSILKEQQEEVNNGETSNSFLKKEEHNALDSFILEEQDPSVISNNCISEDTKDLIDETINFSNSSINLLNEKYQSAYNSLIPGKNNEENNELPIVNLLTAISINDQYLFTRELFNNDKEFYDRSISYINSCSNIHEAVDYMKENFHWKKNETSKKFLEFVKRRFS